MQAYSNAQTMKILDAHAAVDKEWEKAKSLPELQEQKVTNPFILRRTWTYAT